MNLINKNHLQIIGDFCDFSIFDKKNILITGGTGMIGSYLAESIIIGCQIQGYQPLKLRIGGKIISTKLKNRLDSLGYTEFSSDYLLNSKSAGINEIIFHLASPSSHTHYKNLDSLIYINANCLENILGKFVEKFIYFSTSEVYGNQPGKLLREEDYSLFDLGNTRNWYPYAKLIGEERSKELCSAFKIDLAIVRLFHTFGPGVRENDGRSFADFLYSAASGNLPTLKSKGADIRTFLFSADAVIAFINICRQSNQYNIYNVGGESPVTILQFAQKISQLAGLKGEIKYDFSNEDKYIHSPNNSIIPDLTRISNLGWENRISLDDAIIETLDYINFNLKV
jgi:UDP-glucuronate decarboxylase